LDRNIDISQEEFEAIEQYILQQMPAEEKNAFTKRLATDQELQHKFDTVRLLLVGVQEASIKNRMEVFHTDLLSSGKNTIRLSGKMASIKKRWLVAASIIFIATLGSLFYFNQETREEKIFAAYYQPDPGLISAMSATENYLFDRAMIDYKTGKYDAALKTWESMLVSKPGNDTLNYFIGSAYLAKEKNELALAHFQKVILNPDSYFLNDAYWYIGLVLLKENKIREAISFIEKSEHQDKNSLLLKLSPLRKVKNTNLPLKHQDSKKTQSVYL
jgi:tetratricopeptide (TPR) repeat protein